MPDIGKALGAEWKALPAEERASYEARHQARARCCVLGRRRQRGGGEE